ncbi:MAG: DNA adenine methylase [Gammaproteobacteria bacterium]
MDANLPKPFLRWAGSKKKVVPILSEYWDKSYKRYIEPFMGSSVLFFHLQPDQAILSDINSELIDTYSAVKSNPNKVHEALRHLTKGKVAYYKIRNINPKKLNKVSRAARFIYLNRFCFNGIYRTNRDGKFNVPYSNNPRSDLPTKKELVVVSKSLRKVQLHCADFERIISANVMTNDFVYLDPPYAVANRKIFRQYGPQTFGLDDLERLNGVLHDIDKKGAHFLLSYAFCREAKTVFKDWTQRRILTTRNIAGFSKFRRRAVEILATNIA